MFSDIQGEAQYRERLQEISLLKTSLQDAHRELTIRQNDAATIEVFLFYFYFYFLSFSKILTDQTKQNKN